MSKLTFEQVKIEKVCIDGEEVKVGDTICACNPEATILYTFKISSFSLEAQGIYAKSYSLCRMQDGMIKSSEQVNHMALFIQNAWNFLILKKA